MLFQTAKQPTELKITHLNKVKDQRKHQLLAEMVIKNPSNLIS